MLDTTGSTPTLTGWSLWPPVILSVVFSLVFIARTAFTVNGETYFTLFDDAMISMRYARNLAEGNGLLWNAGQPPVEGYTNFLWTLWMALLHMLPIPEAKIALAVMLSGVPLLVANLLVGRKIATHLAPDAPLVASLSIWLTALYYPLIYWTLRGMEVGLITLTLSASVLVALRLRNRFRYQELIALSTLLALGLLSRPDMLVPCAVISGFVVCTVRRKHRWIIGFVLVASIAATLALHTAFRMDYYGAPLPNTYYLKVEGIALSTRLYRGLISLLLLEFLHLSVPVARTPFSATWSPAFARGPSPKAGYTC